MTPTNVRVFVCGEPQDMRCGFDRLALAVRAVMGGDPRSGAIFVFLSRRSDRLKLLWWDHNGFAIMYKRLHRATTRAPKVADPTQRSIEIDEKSLGALLRGVPRPSSPRRSRAVSAPGDRMPARFRRAGQRELGHRRVGQVAPAQRVERGRGSISHRPCSDAAARALWSLTNTAPGKVFRGAQSQ